MPRRRSHLLGKCLVTSSLLVLTAHARAQEITLRIGTKEVAVPFAVYNEYGIAVGCPAPTELTVKEDGRVVAIRDVQIVEGEPIALGIVVSLDATARFSKQDDTRAAFELARNLLDDKDGCMAVNATTSLGGTFKELPRTRQSRLAKGRSACLSFLQDLADRLEIWRDHGDVTGVHGTVWAGISQALRDLDRDPRNRRAILVFGTGVDREHPRLPWNLSRDARTKAIPVYSIYFQLDNITDPKIRAKYATLARVHQPWPLATSEQKQVEVGLQALRDLSVGSGGAFYRVDSESALPTTQNIVAGLRRQCQLTYVPPESGKLGWRKLDVTVAKPGWTVRHRPGYTANQDQVPAIRGTTATPKIINILWVP